jgi:hypothetical protein
MVLWCDEIGDRMESRYAGRPLAAISRLQAVSSLAPLEVPYLLPHGALFTNVLKNTLTLTY